MSEFLQSMPAAYASAFDSSEIDEHARIAERRGAALVHAEICVGRSGAQVCLVADDRPGLLALVTDALLVHGLSIQNAQVYCRKRNDGHSEAVDFFQFQHQGASADEAGIDTSELEAFLQTLSELVAEEVLAASRVSAAPSSGPPPARVYFELEALRRGEFALLVEAPDSAGLLNGITSALHDQGVRIVTSQIRTEAGVARDRFELVSTDGEPLTAVRLCDIQQAVHAGLPTPARRSRPGFDL
jgi:[protein-PII] uridylyltransferase